MPNPHSVSRHSSLLFLMITILLLVLLFNPINAQDANTTVSAGTSSNGMPILLGANGLTLYTFSLDEDGESVCYEQCAINWPPLTIDEGQPPVLGSGLNGTLGTTQRDDGMTQVTYDGWPLYYFVQDIAPGDSNGQGIRDVWFVASPATVMLRHQEGVGDILVGAGGLSLYVFMEDEIHEGKGESYCFDECKVAWPPVIVPEGVEPSAGEGLTGELGIHEREDGSRQVTYNGWPLYYFKMDRNPGDIMGNGMKESWYLAMADSPMYEEDEGMSVGLELIAEGFSAPVAMASNNGRLFIVDQAGTIRIVSEDGDLLDEPFLDLTDKIIELNPEYDERGVLGIAFHPDYANNGRVFVYYSAPLRPEAPADFDHTNVLSEFHVSDDANRIDPDSEQIIWQIDQPQLNHNSGHITFGPDGYLYIPIGDGGGADDIGLGHTEGIGNGQDISNLHGSILRIDVDGEAPYSIPADNPFGDEIFAYGLRNPYHISFDSSGRLFAADAGQDLYEEVDIVSLGGNYGWHIKEGTHCFDPNNPTIPPANCSDTGANGEPLIDPVIEYDHTQGVVVVGGYVVEGSSLSNLNGYYLFGSYTRTEMPPNGLLFAAQVGDENSLWDFSELEISNGEDGRLGAYLLAYGMDEDGEIYIMTSESSAPFGDTGKVWRLVNPDEAGEAAQEADDMEQGAEAEATTDYNQGSQGESNSEGDMVSFAYTNEGIPTIVDADGHTLYTLAFDDEGESTCYDACAEEWPPMLVDETDGFTTDGIPGEFTTVEREDGSYQLAYNEHPLYHFDEDEVAGDAKGQGEEDVWFAANPADVMLSQSGRYLVGSGGMTLYVFTMDELDDSYCRDVCMIAWPPLTLDEGSDFLVGPGITGEVNVIEREDGQMQLSYNGQPLYFFRGDMNPGEINGDAIKDVWYVASLDRSLLNPAEPTDAATAEATLQPVPAITVIATVQSPPVLTPETSPEATVEVTTPPELTPEVTPEATATP